MLLVLASASTAGAERLHAATAASAVTLDGRGVVADWGRAGTTTLPMPLLRFRRDDPRSERPVVTREGEGLLAKYPSGAVLRATASASGAVSYVFSGLPAGVYGFVFLMQVPNGFRLGGRYALHGRDPQPFPERVGAQILAQERARGFHVFAPGGQTLSVETPAGFTQVQDGRAFGGPTFLISHHYALAEHKGETVFTLTFRRQSERAQNLAAGAKGERAAPLIDRFGQSARAVYAGKVASEGELRSDAAGEQKVYSDRKGPALDPYGGLEGSGRSLGLQRTGYFHVERAADRQLLVTPAGNAFFQLGVCGIALTDTFTTVRGREEIYDWLPPTVGEFAPAYREGSSGVFSFYVANWIRKHGSFDLDAWTGAVVERVRRWGFNSGGAFSLRTERMRQLGFPVVGSLPLGAKDGITMLEKRAGAADILDPFAPGNEAALDRAFADKVAKDAADPAIIGYFFGNEQHFEQLRQIVPSLQASHSPAKRKLVEMLRAKYGSIERVNQAWKPTSPFVTFEQLGQTPLAVTTDAATRDVRDYYRHYLEAYFSLVERVFRKHDPNHLLLGVRSAGSSATDRDLVEISGRHVDVLSINYYSYRIEHDFLRDVHQTSGGKPLLLSEWYFGATEQGLRGGMEVRDQAERARAYRNYVDQAAALPFVVGTEWFIYNDQSLTGRFFGGFHGEANNTGLVNVVDRPYRALTDATRESGARIYDVMFRRRAPYRAPDPRFAGNGERAAVASVPRAPGKQGIVIDGAIEDWSGIAVQQIAPARVAVGNFDPRLGALFRLCWDDDHLYLLVEVDDPTPATNSRDDGSLWAGDAVELFLGVEQTGAGGQLLPSDRQIIFGAGERLRVHVEGPDHRPLDLRHSLARDASGKRYRIEVALPWQALGMAPKPGAKLRFDVAIDNSDDGVLRRQQLVWSGGARNSSDRGAWGHAQLH